MSTRNTSGSHYENHQSGAELQDNPAHAHRSAAVTRDKQDHQTGVEHTRQTLEHSHEASPQLHGIPSFGHKEIATLAYELWETRGCPYGSPEEDWFRAVHELRSRRAS